MGLKLRQITQFLLKSLFLTSKFFDMLAMGQNKFFEIQHSRQKTWCRFTGTCRLSSSFHLQGLNEKFNEILFFFNFHWHNRQILFSVCCCQISVNSQGLFFGRAELRVLKRLSALQSKKSWVRKSAPKDKLINVSKYYLLQPIQDFL